MSSSLPGPYTTTLHCTVRVIFAVVVSVPDVAVTVTV